MKLDLVVPTINRIQKISNCLHSIEKSKEDNNIEVHVYFSIEKEMIEISEKFRQPWIHFYLLKSYRVPEFWNAHLLKMKADAMVYLNDDVVIPPKGIKKIIECYEQHFPDFDGVMGLNQSLESSTNKEGAFGVIGKKYADRFPNKQVFCPDYNRFYADEELELYARSIGKFKYDKEAKIIHLHGSFYGKDTTHNEVRKYLKQDKRTFQNRQERKLLWGESFEL